MNKTPELMPHSAAMRESLKQVLAQLGPLTGRPGRPGTVSRMQMTFFTALGQCVAGERDYGTLDRDIFDCLCVALADTLVSAMLQREIRDSAKAEQRDAFERMLAIIKARGLTVINAPSDSSNTIAREFVAPEVGHG